MGCAGEFTVDYFNNEGAIFRRYSSVSGDPIDDVWNEAQKKWVRYTGDRVKRAWYSDRISELDLPLSLTH
jgi:hypothetical protein